MGGVHNPLLNHLCTKILTYEGLRHGYGLRVKTETQNSLLGNINDNGNNNEKTKCSKTWVGIFRVGIFMGRIYQRGNLIDVNFPGGVFLIPTVHLRFTKINVSYFLNANMVKRRNSTHQKRVNN